jgi:hypothetical protein
VARVKNVALFDISRSSSISLRLRRIKTQINWTGFDPLLSFPIGAYGENSKNRAARPVAPVW